MPGLISNIDTSTRACLRLLYFNRNTKGPPKGEDKLKDFDGRGLTIPASVIPFDSSQT